MLNRLVDWVIEKAKQRPHIHLDGYMRRFFLVPETRFGAIRVHEILSSDDDRAYHDHPFWFISIILRGQYVEWRPVYEDGLLVGHDKTWRWEGSVAFRRAKDWHRLELMPGDTVWTLFICGPRKRRWGFLTSPSYKTDHEVYKGE